MEQLSPSVCDPILRGKASIHGSTHGESPEVRVESAKLFGTTNFRGKGARTQQRNDDLTRINLALGVGAPNWVTASFPYSPLKAPTAPSTFIPGNIATSPMMQITPNVSTSCCARSAKTPPPPYQTPTEKLVSHTSPPRRASPTTYSDPKL